jgi:hypothetical protein
MYMCVCAYVCMYICKCMYVYIYVCTDVCVYVCECMYVRTCMYLYMHVCLHAQTIYRKEGFFTELLIYISSNTKKILGETSNKVWEYDICFSLVSEFVLNV